MGNAVNWIFSRWVVGGKASDAYLKKVAVRSRQNYEWAIQAICDIVTKKGDRVGDRLVRTISPRGADKLIKHFHTGKKRSAARPHRTQIDHAVPQGVEGRPSTLSGRVRSQRTKPMARRHAREARH